MVFLSAISALGYFLVYAVTYALVTNLVWNHISNGEHCFHSGLSVGGLFWIYFTNMMAIVLSLGLMIPWAKIRTARYRLEHLQLLAAGDLQQFVAAEQQQVKATGEEVGDFFDVDVSL